MRKHGNKDKKQKKFSINIKQIVLFLIISSLVVYSVYFAISFTGIRTLDPTESNGSQYYLLSQEKDSFEKTLWIFEKGYEDERKIDKVFLFISNEDKEESLVIYIPGWLYSSGLEEDFGNSIPVSSFRYAGDFLQEGRGVEYALWQLNQMLGIKVDNYIWFSTESISRYDEIYGSVSGNSDSYISMYAGTDDLTEEFLYFNRFIDSYSFLNSYLKISEVRNLESLVYSNESFLKVVGEINSAGRKIDQTTAYAIDMGSGDYSTEKLSDAGGMVNYFDSTVFDKEYRSLISTMIDRELEKERVRIEIYNGSDVSGAAQQFGRKIENAGCDVVRYENAPKTVSKTTIYVPDKESFSNSLSIVEETLSGTYELVEGRPSFITTGDIVVVLGEDIQLMYSF